jgi:hypothetical protein
MKRVVLVSLALYLALVLVCRTSIGQFLCVITAIPIAFISLCGGSFFLIFGGTWPALRRLATRAIVVGSVAGSCVIAVPLGSLINRYYIEQAQSFCERLRPELERHKQTIGRYPKRLSQLPIGEPVPQLLRGAEFYHSSGDSYSFSITDPSGIFNGYEFDSRYGIWSRWD